MFLGGSNGLEGKVQREGFTPYVFYAAFHMAFFPTGTDIAETKMETVKSRKPQQGIRRTFLTSTKLLDSHTHIVINQHPGNASRPTEEVPVGLHEGQCVLMAEQAGKTAIAVSQGKHGKEETLKFSLVVQLDFTPVKFADFSRIVILTYKSLLT